MDEVGAMNQFQQRASVHEKTVQAVASGDLPKRTRIVRRGRMASDTYSLKVDPRVWSDAQDALARLRSHGYTRIEIVSEDEVVIR